MAAALMALAMAAGPAWGQQRSSSSSSKDQSSQSNKDQSSQSNKDESNQSNRDQSKDSDSVTRTFGSQGDYRTEVTTETKGKLKQEELRQASLLTAQVFEHINQAREDIDADNTKEALKEVNKAREAIKAIRSMLPKETVRIKTSAPDGKVAYEDEREIPESRIPLFEGMLHAQTLAPILAARRNAMEVAGIRVVESETIVTEAMADLDPIERQLDRAARALEKDKSEDASRALATALIKGLEFRFRKEDKELASARDAIWLARRSLEEQCRPGGGQPGSRPAAAASLPRGAVAGRAQGRGPDAPRC